MKPAPSGAQVHRNLQTEYQDAIDRLYQGYLAGVPDGAADLNAARTAMIGGIAAAAEAVAAAGFLVVFDPPADSRFAPVDPPS